MKKTTILKWIIAALMLSFSVLMLVQISHRGLFHVTENIAFRGPKDLANVCLLLTTLILPFRVLLLFDEKNQTKRVLFAPLISLLVLLCFPIPIKGRVFMNEHETTQAGEQQSKRIRGFFRFEPFWDHRDSYYHVPARLSSYKANKGSSVRWEARGNHFFSHMKRYEINRHVEEQYKADYVYECLIDASTNVLGFVWRDIRGDKFIYQYDGKLPEQFCQMIKKPH